MLESALEAFFQHRIRLVGGMSFKLAPTERGIPDRLVFLPHGRVFLVELKTTEGSLSPLQKELHARLAKLGIRVYVLYGKSQVLDWIRDRVDEVGPPSLPRDRPQDRRRVG